MLRLDCTVQHYAWGDREALPAMLGVEPSGEPCAELWMGAHPKAPSGVAGTDTTLLDVINGDLGAMLGSALAERFGRLPFLFKILSAAQPLSIQAHPSLDQARTGYARENAAGVALDAADRTYRDDNHKPELICALTPFSARVGFAPLSDSRRLVAALVATNRGDELLAALAHHLSADGTDGEVLGEVLGWLLGLGPSMAASLTRSVVRAAAQVDEPAHAAVLDWVPQIDAVFPDDIGSVVALLLNHVELQPGEAVFLGAGNLHAYLRGTGVELMANSDNVVRGGLTPKHIDVAELLSVVDPTPIVPEVQPPREGVTTYASPVPEFRLHRCTASAQLDDLGPRIIIVTEGSFVVAAGGASMDMSQGDVVFAADDDGALDIAGSGVLWVAAAGDLH